MFCCLFNAQFEVHIKAHAKPAKGHCKFGHRDNYLQHRISICSTQESSSRLHLTLFAFAALSLGILSCFWRSGRLDIVLSRLPPSSHVSRPTKAARTPTKRLNVLQKTFCRLNIAKYYGVVGARRAVASMVGTAMVDGSEMRAEVDDRRPQRAN